MNQDPQTPGTLLLYVYTTYFGYDHTAVIRCTVARNIDRFFEGFDPGYSVPGTFLCSFRTSCYTHVK